LDDLSHAGLDASSATRPSVQAHVVRDADTVFSDAAGGFDSRAIDLREWDHALGRTRPGEAAESRRMPHRQHDRITVGER
jgi:hypothetical protein